MGFTSLEYNDISRLATSICSSVSRRAVYIRYLERYRRLEISVVERTCLVFIGGMYHGTKTDQNCPPTNPFRRRGRSVSPINSPSNVKLWYIELLFKKRARIKRSCCQLWRDGTLCPSIMGVCFINFSARARYSSGFEREVSEMRKCCC
jgi:hypothetical protein